MNFENAWPSRRKMVGDPEGRVMSKDASYCFMRVAKDGALLAGCGETCSIFGICAYGCDFLEYKHGIGVDSFLVGLGKCLTKRS